jgi:hypothetical protein
VGGWHAMATKLSEPSEEVPWPSVTVGHPGSTGMSITTPATLDSPGSTRERLMTLQGLIAV